MKLIDKDLLMHNLRLKSYSKKSLELIEKQPEVIAIPIRWIFDYLEYKFLPMGIKDSIRLMINEWEKENETN